MGGYCYNGTVLGPLLFNQLINNVEVELYADETPGFIGYKDVLPILENWV